MHLRKKDGTNETAKGQRAVTVVVFAPAEWLTIDDEPASSLLRSSASRRRAYFHGTSFEERGGTGGKETAANRPVHGCRVSREITRGGFHRSPEPEAANLIRPRKSLLLIGCVSDETSSKRDQFE